MTAQAQQEALFARLDRLFADSPDRVLNEEDMLCTERVAGWLLENYSFSSTEAREVAEQYVGQPTLAEYRAAPMF